VKAWLYRGREALAIALSEGIAGEATDA